MDPLRCAIAALPLAAYFLLIGGLSASRRGVLINGSAELATLGAALTGAVFVGPIMLFRPAAATAELGNYVWLLLVAFYWLWVTLGVLLCHPRLLVLNRTADELRPALAEVIRQLDETARWAGDSVSLPKMGVELHLESLGWLRNTSLIASGSRQELEGWRRLARALEQELRASASAGTRHGLFALTAGATLLTASVVGLAMDPVAVVDSWRRVFAF